MLGGGVGSCTLNAAKIAVIDPKLVPIREDYGFRRHPDLETNNLVKSSHKKMEKGMNLCILSGFPFWLGYAIHLDPMCYFPEGLFPGGFFNYLPYGRRREKRKPKENKLEKKASVFWE